MILVMGIALGTAMNGKAQITASNPLEWMALAEGNELLEKQIDSQINGQKKTAILQNTIAAEFNQMHKWQKHYNSYLKDISGYASSLKACTHLYDDGVRIFITLSNLTYPSNPVHCIKIFINGLVGIKRLRKAHSPTNSQLHAMNQSA